MIPKWYSRESANWAEVAPRHRRFYRYWVKQIDKGNFMDIGEELGYVFIYMKEAINRFRNNRDIYHLQECFRKVQSGYGEDRNVRWFLYGWLFHAYLFLGDYDRAWSVVKDMGFYDYIDISDIIFFDNKCGKLLIDGQTLVSILKDGTGLTEIGEEYRKEITDLATSFLNSFQENHGQNLIRHLYEQFASGGTVEEEQKRYSTRVVTLFGHPCPRVCPREQRLLISPDFCKHLSSAGFSNGQQIRYPAVPPTRQEAIHAVLRRLLRECEDIIRKERGLPKVGEGWVSETELFKKLCEVFPNEKVIQHARPAWLGRQHLDIYFPSMNVAIEYQGAQHQRPIGFFGGEEAFRAQEERDNTKRRLCETHGCRLIYAYPGYDIRDIQHQIGGHLAYEPPTVRNEPGPTDSLTQSVSEEKSTNQQRISLVIPAETLSERPIERLILLANECDRSVDYLVVEAILQYLDREESGVLGG